MHVSETTPPKIAMQRFRSDEDLKRIIGLIKDQPDSHKWDMFLILQLLAYYVPEGEWFSDEDVKFVWLALQQPEDTTVVRVALNRLVGSEVLLKRQVELGKFGYALTNRTRAEIGRGARTSEPEPETTEVSKSLEDLVTSIKKPNEKTFAEEALLCLKTKAYRAAVVMAWNLAYDHLRRWLIESKLGDFNAVLVTRNKRPGKKHDAIANLDDFESHKEAFILEICRAADLTSKSENDILTEGLRKRNRFAHPNEEQIQPAIAAGHVQDLLLNVVTKEKFARSR